MNSLAASLAVPVHYLWHALLMILAWGLLIPAGVLIARFFKVTSGQKFPHELDNQFWWLWHRRLQYAAVLLMSAALWPVWSTGQWPQSAHGCLGLALVTLAWLQVLSAWCRGSKGGPTEPKLRGDHFDMTRRRRVFERWHKGVGWAILLLAGLAMAWGLLQIGLPSRWAWGAPAVGLLILAILFLTFSRQGRWVDTYTAIWGVAAPGQSTEAYVSPGPPRPSLAPLGEDKTMEIS